MKAILGWLAALTAGVWSIENIHDADVWWHLASGRWMWEHGAILKADPFTSTVLGRHWLNYEWLFQAVFFAVYRLGDVPGLLIFRAALWAIGAWGLYRCLADEWPPGLAAAAVLATLSCMRFRNFARAELVSFGLFPWFVAGLFAVRRDPKSWRRWALILAPMMAVWANCHGAFWHGLVVLAISALAGRMGKPWLWLVISVGAAGLLNPFGWELYARTLHNAHMFLSQDWADFNEYAPTRLDAYPAFWLALAAAWGLCFAKARKERKLDLLDWGLLAYATWLGPRFVRNIPFALMLIVPVAARLVPVSRKKRLDQAGAVLCAVLLVLGLRRMSFGVESSKYPIGAADFVIQNRPAGQGFNDFDYGSYLIWAFYGKDLPIFVDGRIHAVDGFREVWKEVQRARAFSPQALDGWRALLEHWKPGWCLMQVPHYRLSYRGRPLSVFAYYFPKGQWALVYHDLNAAVYVRRDAAHRDLIARFERPGEYVDVDSGTPADVPWEKLFEDRL